MDTNYYDYGYDYGYSGYEESTELLGAIVALYGITMVIAIAASIFVFICQWHIYKKAGRKGWEAIVPVYNLIVLLEITNLPTWYIALFFIPFANIYATFKIYIELAHRFGKSTGFGIGLIFLNVIFMPMLAFGKATYQRADNHFYNNQQYNQMQSQTTYQPSNQYNQMQSQTTYQPNNQYNQMPNTQNQPNNQYPNMNNNQNYNQPQTKICPQCGKQLNMNANFCTQCGYNYNN